MKILIGNINFYPIIGGIETHIVRIAEELIKRGHEVVVLCSNHLNKFKEKEKYRGIRIIRYRCPMLPKGFIWTWPIWHQKEISKILGKILEKEKFDIAIAMNYNFPIPFKKFFPKERIIYFVPSILPFFLKAVKGKLDFGQRHRYFLQGRIANYYEKRGIKGIKIGVLSKSVKKQIIEVYGKKSKEIYVIKPGINFSFSLNQLKKKENIALTLSRLTSEKNIDAAIDAFKSVANGNLMIIGGGSEENKLKQKVIEEGLAGKVFFLGWKQNPEKELKKAKIFLFPSLYEGFGLVLLEAMAHGMVCIAFKPDNEKIITASNEIIKNRKTGFLVKDEKEMAEKINLLLDNNKLFEKMSRNAIEEAKNYSWKKHVDELLRISKNL